MTELDPFVIWCPTCGAKTGEPCKSVGAGITQRAAHKQRVTEARRRRDGMPSSPGLQRHTPIKVSRDDKREMGRAELASAVNMAPKKRRRRPNEFGVAVKAKVRKRSGGRCEARIRGICSPLAHDYQHHHHVVLASLGGPSTEENCLGVCWQAHDWIHGPGAAGQAQALGLLGGSGAIPEVLRSLRFEARTLEGELTPAA